MYETPQFAELYRRLPDDELARIALANHLLPEAERALTGELQRRGLTDLSEYKKALEESAAASSPERQMELLTQMKQAYVEWLFAVVASALAVMLPVVWFLDQNVPAGIKLKVSALGAVLVGLSCYFGIKARRRGSRVGLWFKCVIPIILLAISTFVVLGSRLLNLWR
jgi:hypothetical protein